tara:strand:- start:40 stop:468 length:429 start_codon:yes stop_codon:yes gene_type:complete
MVDKLKILLIILLLSSTSFSQKDTSKLCLDYSVAKQVAIDLVKGDSALAELEQTNSLVDQLTFKTIQQDSIINVYKDKDANCLSQINSYNKIREQHTIMVNGLEKDIESIKRENKNLRKATTLLGAGFLGVLVSVITLAFVK